ncbi:unnamed protein product [Sphagnum jensenii]|uniref:Uncharacterized protein n=1 Tax=Sphagnum jensenii TaxID=128206 RepID=A0ABP1BP88_9BRYO
MLIGKEFLVPTFLVSWRQTRDPHFDPTHETSGSSENAEAAKNSEEIANQFDKGLKGAAEKSRAVHGGPVSWVSLALLVVTGIGLLLYWDQEKKWQLKAPIEALLQIAYTTMQSDGAAVVRTGPGVGKAAIGDICPDEVTKLAEAVDEIVQWIQEYLIEFHPRLVGLTGSVKAIQQVAHEYHVYYMKTEDEGNDYLVDHSIFMYLMDPNMDFVKFFGKNYDAKA